MRNSHGRVKTVFDAEGSHASGCGFADSIYLDRNPRLVFRPAARVINELELTPREFGFTLSGSVDAYGGSTTIAIGAEEGIMAFPSWLLVLATYVSATARLLEGSDADVVEPTASAALHAKRPLVLRRTSVSVSPQGTRPSIVNAV